MAAGLQHTRELAHGLLRILDVFQAFEAGYVVERSIAERQLGVKISAVNINALKPKNLRIKIATANIEAVIDQTRGQRTLAGRHIKQGASWQFFKNPNDCVVDRLMRERPQLRSQAGLVIK